MGRMWKISIILLCVLLLFGCSESVNGRVQHAEMDDQSDSIEQNEKQPENSEDILTTDDTQTETPPPEDDPTPQEHSDLYDPQYTTEQIWQYFQEVALTMEYSDGTGNPSLVQKWANPIAYRIYGTPTEEDTLYLTTLLAELNEISGFPGISAAADGQMEDLSIYFLHYDAFNDRFSATIQGEYAYGAVQFWYYTDSNEIHTANIGYRTDIDQASRNSVILEEIVNCLGISDSELREDSIVYQYSNSNTALSAVDWIILKILYNPAISCGMNAEGCRPVVESLYY